MVCFSEHISLLPYPIFCAVFLFRPRICGRCWKDYWLWLMPKRRNNRVQRFAYNHSIWRRSVAAVWLVHKTHWISLLAGPRYWLWRSVFRGVEGNSGLGWCWIKLWEGVEGKGLRLKLKLKIKLKFGRALGEEGGLKVLDGLPIGRCGPSGRQWQPPPWIQLSSENSSDKFISSCLPLTWAISTIGMISRPMETNQPLREKLM